MYIYICNSLLALIILLDLTKTQDATARPKGSNLRANAWRRKSSHSPKPKDWNPKPTIHCFFFKMFFLKLPVASFPSFPKKQEVFC